MSSDLLEFDSYYKSPQETKTPPFPSNASYTPRTNDLSAFESSSTTNWTQAGQSQWPAQAPKSNNDLWNDFSRASISNGQQKTTVDDPWGSLGPPSNSGSKPSSSVNNNGFSKPGVIRQTTLSIFENPGISRSSSFDRFDGPIADYIDHKQQQKLQQPHSPALPSTLRHEVPVSQQHSAPEILFDADDELEGSFEDDDFGEFASAPAEDQTHDTSILSSGNLVDLSASPRSQTPSLGYANNYPIPPKSPSFHERNPFTDLVLATDKMAEMTIRDRDLSTPTSPTPSTAWPTHDEKPIKLKTRLAPLPQEIEEDWGDFADLPPETPDVEVGDKTKTNWSWESQIHPLEPVTAQTPPDTPPPTNIPPPSILLPIFQQLFDLPRSALFQPIANEPFSLKKRILSDPSTIDFLRGYLLIAVVAARILAGRKLRWKRDHHLSQAMKIGLAGGKGGMKLTGIDKAESKREDREAADTVQIWKEQLGRLRSAVTLANSSMGEKGAIKHLTIPEINEVMSVKSLGVAEGAVVDAKACVLCGIKREERITKVDVGVEDSFGEFWVEHWGHVDCRNFWSEHADRLRSR